MRETRAHFIALLGYNDVIGKQETIETAVDLIKGLPSIELLTNVAWMNINLFLHDGKEKLYATQVGLLNELMKNLSEVDKQIFAGPIEAYRQEKQLGVYFNRQSNLKMYELLFTHWNHDKDRKLMPEETIRFLKAYLLINTEVLAKIKIDDEAFEKAKDDEESLNELILAKFIHQIDYKRNFDFVIQTVRGSLFFEYLSKSSTFRDYVLKYLQWYRVENGDDYLYNLLMLITIAIPGGEHSQKSHIVNTNTIGNKFNQRFLARISINDNGLLYRKPSAKCVLTTM